MPLDALKFEIGSEKPKNTEPAPGGKKRGRPPGNTASKVHAQLKEELTAGLKFGALMWSTRDPHCAPILSEISEDIADDLARWASKSKWAAKWVSAASDMTDVFHFFMKIQPLLRAIHEHHIAPAIAAKNDRGEEVSDAGNGPMGSTGPGFPA
ncbi:hypothetical protein ACFWY9_30585 [Amycolatopsis sp. NPDC059027]|uniref:hypothetical protein n=1 Tax=Amycolatopsis sp. NPDC059027 TaxID=3346709 RepID=UPI00366F41BD